jgi:hypothetical protein
MVKDKKNNSFYTGAFGDLKAGGFCCGKCYFNAGKVRWENTPHSRCGMRRSKLISSALNLISLSRLLIRRLLSLEYLYVSFCCVWKRGRGRRLQFANGLTSFNSVNKTPQGRFFLCARYFLNCSQYREDSPNKQPPIEHQR